MKDVFKNKRLWIGIGCAVLVVALIACIILMVGGEGKQSDPTNPATEPTGTTAGGDVTNPSNVTDPENPTLPPENEIPEPTLPDPTVPSEGDTDEEITVPPEQGDGDEAPTDPDDAGSSDELPAEGNDDENVIEPTPTPTPTPDPKPEYDFGGVTVGTIRATDWNSWDKAKRQAFLDSVDWWHITPEEYHNFEVATKYNDYDCGFEGHACRGQEGHDALMEYINAGCEHCGKHDCPSLLVVDPETLFTWPDSSKCPQYDITKDPMEYCQRCGLPTHGEPGTICVIYQNDGTCYACGKWINAWTCHCCDPDDLD